MVQGVLSDDSCLVGGDRIGLLHQRKAIFVTEVGQALTDACTDQDALDDA